ncbi:MAG: hypothetical protein ACI9VR_003327, partial [Cognaticolwellia sp.]
GWGSSLGCAGPRNPRNYFLFGVPAPRCLLPSRWQQVVCSGCPPPDAFCPPVAADCLFGRIASVDPRSRGVAAVRLTLTGADCWRACKRSCAPSVAHRVGCRAHFIGGGFYPPRESSLPKAYFLPCFTQCSRVKPAPHCIPLHPHRFTKNPFAPGNRFCSSKAAWVSLTAGNQRIPWVRSAHHSVMWL